LSTAGMSEDQAVAALQDELTRLANGMAERLIGTFIEITRDVKNTVPDFSDGKISFKEVTETITETSWAAGDLAREGETALDTLTRLSSSIIAVNAIMDTLGHTMFDVGLAGGEMASQLADAFGGLDAMNQATGAYYAAFYTEAERIETATRQTTAALADLGIAMPQTRDQYRAMIEAQDLATQGGRETYAALISLSGAFNEILPAVGSFTNEIARMVNVVAADVQGTMISDALQAQRASEQAAGLWYRTSQTLRAFIAELRGTAGALVSGQQAQAFNQARFQALLSSAIAGDSQAAGDLTGAARALLSSSAATAKSSVEQARMEARVISDLQLASGVSDVEGARHDVIAGLLGNQVDLLGEVRDYLNSGGALDPAQLDALNGQLGSLDGAIKAAEMINYAFLKERLEVTVDLLATANLPADVRSLIANAQTGVTGTIDFVVRSDLGPDEKWLALTGASEHIKTIKYVLDDAQWPQEVQDLALTAGGVYRQTIRYIAQNTMPDRLTELALSDVSSLMKSIIFTAKALPPDVRAIVFNEIAPLQKRINFIQGSDLPADQKRLAMADA
ncbi:MAG: hypothetical protein GW905_13540, partial [Rhodobacterales bacterium]|nr:hypothetical protein [Rhodobacterales bacterium]